LTKIISNETFNKLNEYTDTMAELHAEETINRINTITQAIRKTCLGQNNSTVNLQQCQKLRSELLTTIDNLGFDSEASLTVCLLFGLITPNDVKLHIGK
jgi:hypothetical protein